MTISTSVRARRVVRVDLRGLGVRNISNRWEEASGELLNIRRRMPLAAFGFAFIATDPVVKESTPLILTNWSRGKARLNQADVPDDLSADRIFERLLPALFSRSPVTDHRQARELWLASDPPNAPL